MTTHTKPRVVIIGAGFGGLNAAKTLANQTVDVLLVDRANFHTFTPLLYQVATCGLEPEEIGYPIRGIFRGADNIQFLMGEVTAIDKAGQHVYVRTNGIERQERYDYLVMAAGSVTNYFKTPGVEQHGFELKDLEDAVMLRKPISQFAPVRNVLDLDAAPSRDLRQPLSVIYRSAHLLRLS